MLTPDEGWLCTLEFGTEVPAEPGSEQYQPVEVELSCFPFLAWEDQTPFRRVPEGLREGLIYPMPTDRPHFQGPETMKAQDDTIYVLRLPSFFQSAFVALHKPGTPDAPYVRLAQQWEHEQAPAWRGYTVFWVSLLQLAPKPHQHTLLQRRLPQREPSVSPRPARLSLNGISNLREPSQRVISEPESNSQVVVRPPAFSLFNGDVPSALSNRTTSTRFSPFSDTDEIIEQQGPPHQLA
ncbi:hypothetical protein NUW54_g12405 [Trametes sanguinea]|uniref:Uncharacterized protein n=1 Tax=Trametes sanguinea TaxID=158606 RepID=A0ACC1MXW2_9APHY|nr:hypothetical protein NUW54_g12405 [Trametes sanguinea]